MIHILASMMVMMFSAIIFVMFPENHLLASRRVLGHIDVGISKVMIITSGCLVSLWMVERTFFIFNGVTRRPWC